MHVCIIDLAAINRKSIVLKTYRVETIRHSACMTNYSGLTCYYEP